MADDLVTTGANGLTQVLRPDLVSDHIQAEDLETGVVIRISDPSTEVKVVPHGKDKLLDTPASYTITGGGHNTTIRQTGSNARDINMAWQNLISFQNRHNLMYDPGQSSQERKTLYPATDYWKIINVATKGNGVMGSQAVDAVTLVNLSDPEQQIKISLADLAEDLRAQLIGFESSKNPYWGGSVSAASNRDRWLGSFERPRQEKAQAEREALVENVAGLQGNLDRSRVHASNLNRQLSDKQSELDSALAQLRSISNQTVGPRVANELSAEPVAEKIVKQIDGILEDGSLSDNLKAGLLKSQALTAIDTAIRMANNSGQYVKSLLKTPEQYLNGDIDLRDKLVGTIRFVPEGLATLREAFEATEVGDILAGGLSNFAKECKKAWTFTVEYGKHLRGLDNILQDTSYNTMTGKRLPTGFAAEKPGSKTEQGSSSRGFTNSSSNAKTMLGDVAAKARTATRNRLG